MSSPSAACASVIPSRSCPAVAGPAGPLGVGEAVGVGEALAEAVGVVAVSAAPLPPPPTANAPTGTAARVTRAAPATTTRRRRSATPWRRICGYGTGAGRIVYASSASSSRSCSSKPRSSSSLISCLPAGRGP
ncbi:hypothetical protein [Streptomyces sp. SAI-041]|uniref:hypothetical protein n=1 Tax=Streptomyces sp. SAI-041 TaxID=2940548 RepID=UPI0032AF74BB